MPVKGPQYHIQSQAIEQEYGGGSGSSPTPRPPSAPPSSSSTNQNYGGGYQQRGQPVQQQQQQRNPSSDAVADNARNGKRRGGKLLDRIRRHPIFSPSLVLENSGSVARDHLAAERTFLAYVRTSLGCAAAGVGSYLVYLIVLPKAYSLFTCSSCAAISNDTYRRFQAPRGIR